MDLSDERIREGGGGVGEGAAPLAKVVHLAKNWTTENFREKISGKVMEVR